MTEEAKKPEVSGFTVTEADREKTKVFGKKGSFTIKLPLPSEKIQIYAATSRVLGGANLNSIRGIDYEYARMIVTLNFVIIENPKWWDGADSCVDDNFLLELWSFYIEEEKRFSEFLKKNS